MAEIFGLSGKKVTCLVAFELVTLNLVTTWHGMRIVYTQKTDVTLDCVNGMWFCLCQPAVYVANQVTSY